MFDRRKRKWLFGRVILGLIGYFVLFIIVDFLAVLTNPEDARDPSRPFSFSLIIATILFFGVCYRYPHEKRSRALWGLVSLVTVFFGNAAMVVFFYVPESSATSLLGVVPGLLLVMRDSRLFTRIENA